MAASTKTGYTTRLEPIKARQLTLAGLGRLANVFGVLRGVALSAWVESTGLTPGRNPPEKSRIGPRLSKRRDAHLMSPAMEVV